jgi:uncharacterized protein YhdP
LAILRSVSSFGPQIEKSKASVEKVIGARVGVKVTIDDLHVSWTGIRPSFEIDGLRFTAKKQNHLSSSKEFMVS